MSEISRESKVARNAEVLHREVEGETVLLDAESGTYYTLNETGSAIWEMICRNVSTAWSSLILIPPGQGLSGRPTTD